MAKDGRASVWMHVAHSVRLGAILGATAALLEISIRLFFGGFMSIINPSFYFPAMVIYAMAGGLSAFILGLFLAILSLLLFRSAAFEKDNLMPLYFTLIASFAFFLMVGGYINSLFLPSYLDIQSLVFDGVFLVVAVVLGILLYRLVKSRRQGLRRLVRVWQYGLVAILVIAFLVALPRGESTGDDTAAAKLPPDGSANVLVLLIDTLRADYLSCYGFELPTSPNIDKFAGEGAQFLNTFSPASWTKPATASLMTGFYPSTHQANTMGSGLSDSFEIMPEIYKKKGYRTAIFTSNNLVSPLFGFDQGVDFFYYGKAQMIRELMLGDIIRTLSRMELEKRQQLEAFLWELESYLRFGEQVAYDLSADALNTNFLEWAESDAGRPFFAYIHYIEPHYPYTPPPPYDSLFAGVESGEFVQPEQNYGFQPFDRMDPVDPELVRTVLGEYMGEIAYIDDCLGRFFSELDKRGILDKTLVVLTADHGEEFFEHSMWGHGHSLFNEVVDIPLIMRYPALIPPGTKVSTLASLVDILPTLYDFSGIQASHVLPGKSLLPFLREGDAVADGHKSYGEVLRGGQMALYITDGTYKLLKCEKGVLEETLMFSILEDPSENTNLSDSLPDLKNSLLIAMEEIHKSSSSNAVEQKEVEIDKTTEDQLKAMGYIQ
jgi:arylsulfatase A-like enzyme